MGARKRLMAEKFKEAKKNTAIAKLNDVPTSPRKMRLVADTVRGVEVNRAIDLLHFRRGSRLSALRSFSAAPSPTGKPRIRIRPKSWTTATFMSRRSWSAKAAR